MTGVIGREEDAFGCGLVAGMLGGALFVVLMLACFGVRAEYTTIDKRLDEVAADVVVIRRAIEAPPPTAAAPIAPICVQPEASP